MSNSSNDENEQKSGAIERHFGTIVSTLILAGILWLGDSNVKFNIAQTRIAGDINLINSEMNHLKSLVESATSDRFTTDDFKYHEKITDSKFVSFETRLKSLEDKVK